jgi:hypothetical protein
LFPEFFEGSRDVDSLVCRFQQLLLQRLGGVPPRRRPGAPLFFSSWPEPAPEDHHGQQRQAQEYYAIAELHPQGRLLQVVPDGQRGFRCDQDQEQDQESDQQNGDGNEKS